MSTLSYKGYQGSVTYEDGRLIIQVLHVDDLLTVECVSAEAAQREFESLLDEYLETCAKLDREPQKPFKGSFNVRISPSLHKEVAMVAAEAEISLNAWVVASIEEKLQRDRFNKSPDLLNIARQMSAIGKTLHAEKPQGSEYKWFVSKTQKIESLSPEVLRLAGKVIAVRPPRLNKLN